MPILPLETQDHWSHWDHALAIRPNSSQFYGCHHHSPRHLIEKPNSARQLYILFALGDGKVTFSWKRNPKQKEVPRKGVSWYCAVSRSFILSPETCECHDACERAQIAGPTRTQENSFPGDTRAILTDSSFCEMNYGLRPGQVRNCSVAVLAQLHCLCLARQWDIMDLLSWVISKRYEELIRGRRVDLSCYLAPQAVAALRLGRSVSSSASCCLILSWAASNALEESQIKN